MNGRGTKDELRMIVSLSCIPTSLSIIYLLVAILIPGEEFYTYGGIDLLVWIFSLRILIVGVAKIQKISYVFALMNICVPSILVTILYLVLRY